MPGHLRAAGLLFLVFPGIAPSGSAQSTSHPIAYYNPSWSSDGRSIVFESDGEGRSAVYTVEVGDGTLRRLSPPDADAYQPAWDPAGRRIVFAMKRDGSSDLYVMNRDGSDIRRLTDRPGSEFFASFSPDGKSIAFGLQFPEQREVYYVGVVQSDGSGYRILTDSTVSSSGPRWSADGRHVDFTRTPRLTPAAGEAMPDFFRRRDAASRLVSARPDGADARDIGPASGEAEPGPVDSPDGRFAVVSREMEGHGGLYLVEKSTRRERILVGGGPAQ